MLASDAAFHTQLTRTLGYATYGAAEVGECLAICQNITPQDYNKWFDSWFGLAQEAFSRGEKAQSNLAGSLDHSGYLAASNYARTALFFADEIDEQEKIKNTLLFSKHAFQKALAHSHIKYETIRIPFDGITLPGFIYFAEQFQDKPRPYIIDTGGGDNTLEELFFNAIPAIMQGYHYVTFEGPGQGSVLKLQHLPLRPDWETVITQVINFCEKHTLLKNCKKALYGISFGGYLAPRAATQETRIDALIADPGIVEPSAFMLSKFPQNIQDDILSQNQIKTDSFFQTL